jgi:hypothetical protein
VIERPILFSAPMVRAILDGTKTQTRRVVTVPWHKSTRALPYEPYWVDDDGELLFCDEYGDYHTATRCMAPYGHPGDRLWVRETHAPAYFDDGRPGFRADWTGAAADVVPEPKWKPSIFMRRHDSRITLDVTSVRIERLHKITAEDARAEGVQLGVQMPCRVNGEPGTVVIFDPIKAYAVLWDSINGKRPGCAWADNPWVWRVAFERDTTSPQSDKKEPGTP